MILTPGQAEVVSIACKGHNLLVTGQAGTGKSTVVNEIIASVCSSGLSCTVYEPGLPSTVHSHYGLGTAELPWRKLVERSLGNEMVVNNLKKCDTVIWDEASMSSQQMFELVNLIHHKLSHQQEELKPFGGKQIILVGEFLQLRPVPSDLDEMFNSVVFQRAITHRFEMTGVMRHADEEFLSALRDIRLGKCSQRTSEYFSALSHTLSPEIESKATHIYFKKLPVSLHNRQALQGLAGADC